MNGAESLVKHLTGKNIRCDISEKAISEYSRDASQLKIPPLCVVFPESAEQISETVRFCRVSGLPVTVAGGHTGLSGGILGYNAVRIETLQMNRFTIEGSTIRCEPGVSVPEAMRKSAEAGYVFPVQPASACRKDDAYTYLGIPIGPVTVGGSLGANASGLVGCRLGAALDWVKELTVVLPDGSVKTVSEGFDRYVGTEGKYGIITEALLELAPVPQNMQNMLLRGVGYRSFSDAAAAIGKSGKLPLLAESMVMGDEPPDLALIAKKTFDEPKKFLSVYGGLFDPRAWLILLQAQPEETDAIIKALNKDGVEFSIKAIDVEDFTKIKQIRSAASDEIGTGVSASVKGEIEAPPVQRAAMFLAEAVSIFIEKGIRPKGEHNLGILRTYLEEQTEEGFNDGTSELKKEYGDLETFFKSFLKPQVSEEMVKTKTAVNFPGNEDILIRAEQFEETMDLLNRLMKKYGACPVPLYYCHVNFRKQPGWLLIHNRLLIDVAEFI